MCQLDTFVLQQHDIWPQQNDVRVHVTLACYTDESLFKVDTFSDYYVLLTEW